MRRAKLAPGSVPAGSLPTSSCHMVPRCFVCDEPIKSHRLSTSLLAGRTQYTHSPLPTKIGGYIGDEFVVVVTPQDALCKHCMALINTMDRLELELRQHRYTLTQHLKTKYKLDGHAPKTTKYEVGDEDKELDEPEVIEVSDEEWTPNNNKKQRTDSGKQHHCTICSASYTNLSLFMAHLSRHKQMVKTKSAAVPILTAVKSSIPNSINVNCGQGLKFKCGCCSECFPTKESLALHMQLHTGQHIKSKAGFVFPPTMGKSVNETYTSVLHVKPEPTVQTSSLFEDLEQLSQQQQQPQEVPTSAGVCSEEQKGRVCLLALLNNGVCSDLSHRTPVDGLVQNSPENPVMNSVPKVSNSSVQQTISITVSIPSVTNGGEITEQQISLPAVSQHSNPVTLSYPMTYADSSITSPLGINSLPAIGTQANKHQENGLRLPSQSFNNLSHSTDIQNSCLGMPDLCGAFSQGLTKVNDKVYRNSPELTASKNSNRKETPSTWNSVNTVENLTDNVMHIPLMSSSGLDQGMDMPSLIDEDMNTRDARSPEAFVSTTEKVSDSASGNTGACTQHAENTEVKKEVNSHSQLDLNSSGSPIKNGTTAENIAIVSVTSVQMSRDNLDTDDGVTDWLYSSSGKDISPVLEEQKTTELDSSVQVSWFNDSDHLSVSEKLQSGKCNANEFLQTMATDDGKAADEQ